MDYVGLTNFSVNFFSGDQSGTRRCANVIINEDTIVEYDEMFNVILTENSDRLVIQNNRNSTVITIIEDGDSKFKSVIICDVYQVVSLTVYSMQIVLRTL